MAGKTKLIYQARETLFLPGRRVITQGELIEDGDPALIGREDLFVLVNPPVEQMTNAPGETRSKAPRRNASTGSRPASGLDDDDV